MAVIRLDSEERRRAIIDAALPLFARKGFAGTTTKELAEAAGVSEALIFKHFPSKAALYAEILQAGCVGDPVLAQLRALEPSTETLVRIVRGLVTHFVETGAGEKPDSRTRHRLMVASFLEDGEFARLLYEWVHSEIAPIFTASMAAAERAGDIVEAPPVPPEHRFWFANHSAFMLAISALPGRPTVPLAAAGAELARQAAWFILRGFGLKDEVIAAYDRLPWESCPADSRPASSLAGD